MKTTQQAVNDLKNAITEELPDSFYTIAEFVHKYRIASVVFQVLAIVYLVIGEYPSALIMVIISLYFLKR